MIAAAFPAATSQATNSAHLRTIRERGLAGIESGNLAEADSLLSLSDSAGMLSAHDYLRWLEVKAVLSDYKAAARLCCKIDAREAREPRLSPMGRGRLLQMIEEQPAAVKREALAAYRGCALMSRGCDTLVFKQWLSRAYASFGLFAQQDSLLAQLDTKNYPSAQDYLDAAAERFSQGFVSEAVVPAQRAYDRANGLGERGGAARSLTATMLFMWYRQALKPDSASHWLERASLSDERLKVPAIAFLQGAGMLDRADSLLATLRPSVIRDTLTLRQMLFAGDAKGAYSRAGRLPLARDAFVLWKTRTAVFSGNGNDLYGWIDTVSFAAASDGGEEILSYRYRLDMLAFVAASAPQALHDFCALSYGLWRGKPDKTAALRFTAYPRDVREMLVCDIVKGFIRLGRFGEAQAAAATLNVDSAGPELRYYYADCCLRQGFLDKGAAVLEQLMLAFPNDVFSGRARILLANLKKKKK
jgi:hypothetical protein